MAVSITDYVDFLREDVTRRNGLTNKTELDQFFSAAPLARLMASMFRFRDENIHILDPCAGLGSLFAACVEEILRNDNLPREICVTAYEIDSTLCEYIRQVFDVCEKACSQKGVKFSCRLIEDDFIQESVALLGGLVKSKSNSYDKVILNPPYGKINVSSHTHRMLRSVEVDATNLYSAFLELAGRFLAENGEIVSITPRSFCNGPYFKSFRTKFFQSMRLRRIHLFTSRTRPFREEDVRQENIILCAVKNRTNNESVVISTSEEPTDEFMTIRKVAHDEVVFPWDEQSFIRIVPDEMSQQISDKMLSLKHTLSDLNLEVSTGRVVDFRSLEFVRKDSSEDTVPLICPLNIVPGFVRWPLAETRRWVSISRGAKHLLVPRGNYVLTRRLTTTEERRRIVAAVYDPLVYDYPLIGFDNKINYFHRNGNGFDIDLAKGLVLFLNSTIVDLYFRQFNGNTQVNANDLRTLRYPSLEKLSALGKHISKSFPSQNSLDELVREEIFDMGKNQADIDINAIQQKLSEASSILKTLGLDKRTEMSALTLLSLLDLKPSDRWSDANDPQRGIRNMMDFFAEFYGKKYAENTREEVREQPIRAFIHKGLVRENPDDPKRAKNSKKWVYQIQPDALTLFRTFGTPEWDKSLSTFKASIEKLRIESSKFRAMHRIPVKYRDQGFSLSPGGQNVLIKKVIEDFGSFFTSGGRVIYIGDSEKKDAYYDNYTFQELGIALDKHEKAPDIIIYDENRNWLFLIEAVTSSGSVTRQRKDDLRRLFSKCSADLVFVTAFLDRKSMSKHLSDISWETEVWVADYPEHLIHFNGERFLGPYDSANRMDNRV